MHSSRVLKSMVSNLSSLFDVNNKLLRGTVPLNNELFGGSVSPNSAILNKKFKLGVVVIGEVQPYFP